MVIEAIENSFPILVPETKLENVGIRSLCTTKELQDIFLILSEYDLESILKYYQNTYEFIGEFFLNIFP